MIWIAVGMCLWLYITGMLAMYAIDPQSFGQPVVLMLLLMLLWPIVVPAVAITLRSKKEVIDGLEDNQR